MVAFDETALNDAHLNNLIMSCDTNASVQLEKRYALSSARGKMRCMIRDCMSVGSESSSAVSLSMSLLLEKKNSKYSST
jgi:hypothetical protein